MSRELTETLCQVSQTLGDGLPGERFDSAIRTKQPGLVVLGIMSLCMSAEA